jgi:catechol 2,3-dioxygenase-like lactoylglutathione lyase family enzyme
VTWLHHVNVLVPAGRSDEVAAFYADVLGLRRITKPAEGTTGGGAWLEIDERTQLHLSERPEGGHPDQHFALVVDDFDDVMARLGAAGAPWTEQADLFGGRRGFTRDPAGNRIELCERSGTLA